MAASQNALSRLLRPRSIAIIGASATPGSLGGGVLANLDRFGFQGDLHLVNPTRPDIGGRPCLPSTRDLPEGVDCAVIAIPGQGVLDAIAACGERGVGAAIVFSGGFAESGPEGLAAQAALVAEAGRHGMRLLGPNCLGLINYVDGVPLTFGSVEPKRPGGAGVAVVSQSGAMAAVLRAALAARQIDTSYSVSTGNEAASETGDFVEYLIDDPSTRVIALIVEQFRQPRKMLALAERAREKGKPVLLLHPGRSSAARLSAQTHTGAMAGDHQVMRALMRSAGVTLLDTLEELIDLAELHIRCPGVPRHGPMVLTDSGAFKGMALDYCETLKLPLPEPDPDSARRLSGVMPAFIGVSNPLDLTAQALVDPDLYRRVLEQVLEDPACGSVVLSVILSSESTTRRKVEPIIAALKALRPRKPVVFAMLGDETPVPQELIDGLRALGSPFFRSPERAFRALARFTQPAAAPTPDAAPCPPGPPPADDDDALPPGMLAEHVAKAVLRRWGLRVPDGALATSADAAVRIADRLGYPVALKAQAAALSHKTDAGGVVLGLASAAEVSAAWDAMHARIAARRPGLVLDGVLVECMGEPGLEIILGARRDPDWGPVLLLGLGGVYAELLHDVRLLPAGCTPGQVLAAVDELQAAALFKGFRGAAPRDLEALVDAVRRLGQAVIRHPEIVEVDINPLMLHGEGQGALALDALILNQEKP